MSERIKNLILAGVVAVAVALLVVGVAKPATTSAPSNTPTGLSQTNIGEFPEGVKNGDLTRVSKSITIGSGANQTAFRNTTGRTIYVAPYSVSFGFTSGTATSSSSFYVGTSTASTFTDFARPTPVHLIVDGGIFATSTTGTAIKQATTTPGYAFAIPDGSYLIFDVQERFACKSDGICNTATSTNRGVTNYTGSFEYWY